MDEKSFRSLKSDLTRQKDKVRANIVYSVNLHYLKYQSVAASLLASRDQIALARGPLSALQTDVESLEASAVEERQLFAHKLSELESVRQRKKVFLFLADCDRKLVWLESQIADPMSQCTTTTTTKKEDHTITNVQRLEHISMFVSLLNASVSSCTAESPIVPILSDRLKVVRSVCEKSATSLLQTIVTGFLDHKGVVATDLQSCARSFQYLAAWPQFLVQFITSVVDPALIQAQSTSAKQQPLPAYLTAMTANLTRKPFTLCPILKPHVSKHLYTSLTHHIILRLIEALDSRITASNYSASVPSAFHRNYSAVLVFFRDIFITLDLVCYIDRIPELNTYMRKWPVETYYQLVARQISTEVETNPADSQVIIGAITRIADAFLATLVHRFFKLVVQIVQRHHRALSQSDAVDSATAALKAITTLQTTHAAILSSAVIDRHSLMRQGVEPVLAEGQQMLETKWRAAIEHELVSCANDVLRQTRSIAAQYRATGRPSPTSPSAFISHTFRETGNVVVSGPPMDAFWAAVVPQIIVQTCSAYAGLVQELLTTLKKTEESLKRLKHAKRGATKDIVSGTDEDKIRAQIALDVHALASEIRSVPHSGGDETVNRALTPVWDILARFQIKV